MKTALIFGSTGFIGSMLLEELLNNTGYSIITAVVRKPLNIAHPKLKVLIGDYNSLPSLASLLVADDVFISLGTTKKNTPDEKLYYQVDHDYPVLAAKLAKENGATSLMLVSAVGPNTDSNIFYVRTKGETERDIIALEYAHTHIFRPSMLMGDRKNEKRPMEKFLVGLFKVVNPLLVGSLRKFRGIQGHDVAKAMIAAANKTPALKMNVYEWKEMMELANTH